MTALTLFGFVSVSLMLLFYAFEHRSPWFVLLFAISCLSSSTYGFLQGAWPFGLVEGVWTFVALKRWWSLRAPGATSNPVAASENSSRPAPRPDR